MNRGGIPGKVLEVWNRVANPPKQIRDHHLFLRAQSDERFFYAGPAHLDSYGSTKISSGEWGFAANSSLNCKLPRVVWVHLGGYPEAGRQVAGHARRSTYQ